jgi:hypothetical protein
MAKWQDLTAIQKSAVATAAESCSCLSDPDDLASVVRDTVGIPIPTGSTVRSKLLKLFADIDDRNKWPEFVAAVDLYNGAGTNSFKDFEKALQGAGLFASQSSSRQLPKDQFHFFDLQDYDRQIRNRMRESSGLIGLGVLHAEDRFLEALANRILEHPKLREHPSRTRKKPPYRLGGHMDWSAYRTEVIQTISKPGHCILSIVPHHEPDVVWNDIVAQTANLPMDGYKFVLLAGSCLDGQHLHPLVTFPRIQYEHVDVEDWLYSAFDFKGWNQPASSYIESVSERVLSAATDQDLHVYKIYEVIEAISRAFGYTCLDDFKNEVEQIFN